MQLEIKFRAKQIENNEWIYGYAIFNHDKSLAWIITEGYEATYGPNPDQNIFRVIPETVGQFTGVLDRKKKEIYDGDIVLAGTKGKAHWGSHPTLVSYYINQQQYKSCWSFDYHKLNKLEVIGNMHDTPELLNKA